MQWSEYPTSSGLVPSVAKSSANASENENCADESGYTDHDARASVDNRSSVRPNGAGGDPVTMGALKHKYECLALRTVRSLFRITQRVDNGC